VWLSLPCHGRWPVVAAATLLLCARAAPAVDIPPIRYDGELRTTVRTEIPDEGEQTWQLGSINRLGLSSYLWQPWFATVDGNIEVSQINTFAETDSNSLVLGGGARVNLFPRSRFPFTAFFDITDSRSELESTFAEDLQTRQTRYGVTQQYRPLSHNATYSATLQRVEETGTGDDFEQTSNFADLRMTYRLDKHNFDASVNVEQTSQNQPDVDLLDMVSNLNHSYRPSDEISIQNFASLSRNTTESGSNDVEFTNGQLSSFVVWTPRDSKLQVTGNGRFNYSTSSTGPASTTVHTSSGNVTASYEVTPALRVTGTVDGTVFGGDASATTLGQSVTASYSPPSIPLGEHQYTYFASTGASNRNSSIEGSVRTANLALGHSVARFLPLSADGAFSLAYSLSQSGTANYDTLSGNTLTLTHSGSTTLSHSVDGARSSLQFDVRDSRDVAGDTNVGGASEIQTVTAQALHDRRFGRYATLTASANVSWTRQSLVDGGSSTFPSTTLSVGYRHSRFFGVRRLRFSSELSTISDSLSFFTAGDQNIREIDFQNKLEYSIGRVEARLEATARESNGRINSFVFFTLTRRIGGVL